MVRKILLLVLVILFSSCTSREKIRVILDTDANNELDDQHAIAYLIANSDLFAVEGITTNRTWNGGPVENHTAEAVRIVKLCNVFGQFPVISGANGSYYAIKDSLVLPDFDGYQAVDLIIRKAHETPEGDKLLLLAVGKITNIALALTKDPAIIPKVKVVWLGSNWPVKGEYNLENDTSAVNPVIGSGVEMWICTVVGGTMEVKTTRDEITERLTGLGPVVDPVEGRHGGSFSHLGDYLVNLWEHMEEVRSLFDMAAVANVKNPDWAQPTVVYEPRYVNGEWIGNGTKSDSVIFFRNYNVEAVMGDFWETMERFGE